MSHAEQPMEEDDNCVTMVDVLQKENQLEEDANAVLGASDDKNCTYNKGYIRQALYSCRTCCQTKAAICLACSYQCHEGHDLIELYTKRHFRCDCGNAKFGEKKCSIEPLKLKTLNEENYYNHNFLGLYCTCGRPYPDPENDDDDEMLQCVICEDWYHTNHLGVVDNKPDFNSFDEVICACCMNQNDFIWRYTPEYSATEKKAKEKMDENVDVVDKVDVEDKVDKEDVDMDSKKCTMPKEMPDHRPDACAYLIEGWRAALCTCENCKKMYEEKKVMFLLDPLDSVKAYEEQGKINGRETQHEKGMRALASLGRVQQINAIRAYNDMKENLIEFLRKFAENKEVVKEEDIKTFFNEMESKKRPKSDDVQTFCR